MVCVTIASMPSWPISAGTARIATIDAVGQAEFAIAQAVLAHHLRRHGEPQRGIGQSGVGADFVIAITVFAQYLRVAVRAGGVIFRCGRMARAGEPDQALLLRHHFLDIVLITAVIAQEDDVLETMDLETVGGGFQRLF